MASGHGHLVTYGTKSGTLPSLSGLHLRALQREDTFRTVVQNHQKFSHFGLRFSISNVSHTFRTVFSVSNVSLTFCTVFSVSNISLTFCTVFSVCNVSITFCTVFCTVFSVINVSLTFCTVFSVSNVSLTFCTIFSGPHFGVEHVVKLLALQWKLKFTTRMKSATTRKNVHCLKNE